MSIEDANRIYSGKIRLDETEREKIVELSGFAFATVGQARAATHAICSHGHITRLDEDHHSCRWAKLLRLAPLRRRGGNDRRTVFDGSCRRG